MSFALRKVWLAAGATIAAGVTLAAFTSPPFNSQPTRTVPMVWQCYSALVERTSAVCATAPVHPSNVIPARTHWYLVQCKAQVLGMVASGKWTHPSLSGYHTNKLTTNSILTITGLGADFWTNTPPAGQATATNGWHGLRRIITNLVWSVENGSPSEDCGGASNVWGQVSGFWCSTNPMTFFPATVFPYTVNSGFPLFEQRYYIAPTHTVYRFSVTIDDIEGAAPCDTEWTEGSPQINFSCFPPTVGIVTDIFNCVDGFLDGSAYRTRTELLETITDPCNSNYLQATDCSSMYGMCARVAPITFPSCVSMTGQTFAAEEWYKSGATNPCSVLGEWNNPFSASLSSTGWAQVFSYTSTNGAELCRTNFATARTPWDGMEVNYAWAIYDAVIVKKWNFDY